ncbi:MAG: sugar ABC transporter permease [Chloroflexi bacterium]|nr:sugar ABC transporter permease [Chloroflexota bacterium]
MARLSSTATNSTSRRANPNWLAGLAYVFKKSNKWGYVFIAPLVLDFLVFTVYMVFYAVQLSFQEMQAGQFVWIGLNNYTQVLQNPLTWNAMRNTFIYTLSVVVLGLGAALVLSELIFRRGTRTQVFYKSAFYLPAVVSSIVVALVWTWIFNPFFGILNAVTGIFGIPKQNWLGNPDLALASLILMAIIGGGGSSIVLLTASMGGIPTELYDAAKIDGASEWTRFTRVTVPLLRPTLLYLFVTGFIGNFQVFEQVYVMTSGGPGFPPATDTVGFRIYDMAFRSVQFGGAAALSLLLFLVILVFSVFQFRLFAAELEY